MLGPIFFKEYQKIRWSWFTLIILNGLLMAFIYVETRHIFAMDHAEMVWYQVIHLGQIHYKTLKFATVLTGLLVACFQYLPEVACERLRLSLHLPVSPHRLILTHLSVGLTAVGLIILLDLSGLMIITAAYFPAEVVANAFLTSLPWGFAGMAAYLGATLGLLEPAYRLRLFNLGIASVVTALFLFPAEPGGFLYFLPFTLFLLLLMVPAVLLPAYHFRFRRFS